ncbi:helix-turn-helix domain-containing protein [Rhodococcus artemisiae]|uniref:Helix-turn-helix domain-containing protein n=1 Tax=Rhodococcus artemisiae TaxID=714159 RepID=A0ABU7LH41_9NOCA|nr:helix-turn-helix domain-containing protein [Rhodococcus artemisiae]MEE2060569.1 helix-turn-helix domain-containing protein [Rhodococcus artemisiae]
MATSEATPPQTGTKTLARGLQALELVAHSPTGLTIQEVADQLGVHRSIATRLLATIAEYQLISRGPDGRYRAAGGLAALAREVYTGFREHATPLMQDLADRIGASVALFVAEAEDAVAVTVREPSNSAVRVSFRQGGRHPLDRGAAGYALLAAGPPRDGEDARVTEGRRVGHVLSYGEVERGYWGLGVPLTRSTNGPLGCLTVISASKELLENSVDATMVTAAQLSIYRD